ncbi:hypothetical protein BST97_07185 [Nonlabens spongiae]|uniref:Uncharacterized protein n=1 Tax=Nonlabens spongiae TaxID=331648 RepID=A0A1W6MK00_9FLAO|nr:hypothetical protein [Nonlabens spongiae]ARN77799.1 hypothetical protein BST97_07185 [Nonlabens spongiae]
MNGAPIHANDKLAGLNARRRAVGVQQFSYVDRTSGPFIMQSDKASGDTTTMMSAFHYIAYPLNERDSLNYRYKLKVAGDRIHYIRVYLEGEEYW